MLDFISIEHCRLLVQMLGHSQWQASLIAIVCWLILRELPASRTSLRYGVACAGLLLVVAAVLGTSVPLSPKPVQFTEHARIRAFEDPKTIEWFKQTVESSAPAEEHASHAESGTAGQSERIPPSRQPDATASTSSDITWPIMLAGFWASGVLLMFGRVARQLLAVRRLRTPSGVFDSELITNLQNAVDELMARLKLRFPVRLVVSDRVSVPGVIGTFWPVLLLPPAMLSGVPIEQLRIVIAHELAHARRFDFLVNLGQLIVESLLFFNPAVWWLSRQIRIEREACCDAAAVSATGSPVPVARTLLAIVERLRESLDAPTADRFAAAAGVQSFAGQSPDYDNSSLFDRVRRIVTPEQRPHVRVPWYTLLGIVAAYGLVSFGLYEGTAVTVHAVQQALTRKERVEKIERLIAAKGELARSEGVAIEIISRNGPPQGEMPTKTVEISGTVRTHDGSPIPECMYLLAHYDTRRAQFSGSGNAFDKSFRVPEFPTIDFDRSRQSFDGTVTCISDPNIGSTWLTIMVTTGSGEQSQFTPVTAGPFNLTADDTPAELEFVLQPGFDTTVQIVDEDGLPVSGAFVSGGLWFADKRRSLALTDRQSVTGESGEVSVTQATSRYPWHVQVRAPGFQSERFSLTLSNESPNRLVLKRAAPTTLDLTMRDDGQPVSRAFAYLAQEDGMLDGRPHAWGLTTPDGTAPETYEKKYARLFRYGPSDEEGRITLDSLVDGSHYRVLIQHDDIGAEQLEKVRPGVASIPVKLSLPLSVAGRILGDLSKLKTTRDSNQRYFRYEKPSSTDFYTAQIDERDGVGHFKLTGLGTGRLLISLPDRRIRKELTTSIEDLVINLDEPPDPSHGETAYPAQPQVIRLPPPKGASRKVILTLTGAAPGVPIEGWLRVGYLTRDEPDSYSSANLDIVDSNVEFDVEVPTKIHWVDRSFTGYSVVGRSEVEVGVGDEPFQLDIPLLPGGGVRGEVRLADGSLARDFHVDLQPVDRKSNYKGAEEDIDQLDPPGEFVLTGVPFDQKFRLLVTDGRIRSVAAIVSEPFSLSAAEPIADLKFQFVEGQTHVIRLLDEDGQPAIGAKADFAFNPGLGFVRSHGWKVNDYATVVFEHVSDSIPGETTFQVSAAGPFRGQKLKLDWANLPKTLTLQRGLPAAGTIVDEATGRGVAVASFFLFPAPSTAAEFRDAVWGKTDELGQFSFECLEPINYQLNLYGAVPPRVPFKANARGVLEPDYSNIKDGTFPEWFVKGGSSEPVTIQLKLVPGSRLKLTEPESGN